jgi:hypothetical protein
MVGRRHTGTDDERGIRVEGSRGVRRHWLGVQLHWQQQHNHYAVAAAGSCGLHAYTGGVQGRQVTVHAVLRGLKLCVCVGGGGWLGVHSRWQQQQQVWVVYTHGWHTRLEGF